MSSSADKSLPSDPNSPAIARPSIPPVQTSISLDERPLSEGNDSMASPSLPVDSQRPSFSPADCSTLQKILHDVRSPSPLSLTVTPRSNTNEDKVSCGDAELARGDERQDGYEDDSMELSDGEDAFGADEGHSDTIEDIMNLPGKTAPPVPVHDYSSFYVHDKPPSDGARELELRRASIKRELAELDQFRDIDLAPIETAMEGGPAGDLIMCGTPVKAKDEELFLRRASDTSDSEIDDWNHTQRSQSSIPSPRRHTLLIEQDEENDADVEESDTASSSEWQQLAVFARPPTFVTVVGMLPAAMFWATVAPVVEGSSKAFDMLIEKLTGLKV